MDNSAKASILSIGGNGLIGSRISELLSSEHSFTNVGNTQGVNITDPATLDSEIGKNEYTHVLLLAAKSDVDSCEVDKELGEEGETWKINVEGTQNVVNACIKHGKKLIYISTDFVFDGEKKEGEYYTEEDIPSPVNWYGMTKYEGEKRIISSGVPHLILRIAYPYRANFDKKNDFVRAIATLLKSKPEISAVSDHLMTPTLIDDIAVALNTLIDSNEMGIFHIVGSEVISPYDAAKRIKETLGGSGGIKETTRSEFFSGRAKRPFNLSLKNDKIVQLGIKMRTFTEGLQEVKKQL